MRGKRSLGAILCPWGGCPHDDQGLGVDQPPVSGALIQDPEQVRVRHGPDDLAPVEEFAVVPRVDFNDKIDEKALGGTSDA